MSNLSVVSPWYGADRIETLLESLSVGDLLEFDRGTYKHWAVCISIGSEPVVIHRTGDSSTCHCFSNSLNKASAGIGCVCLESILEVLSNYKVRINNSTDRVKSPKSVRSILYNALAAVDNDELGVYNVLLNNCEHFANWCRYGVNTSKQANTTLLATVVGFAGVFVGVALRIALRVMR